MNMLSLCVFVPFLHVDTPKPSNVSNKPNAFKKDSDYPTALIESVTEYRIKLQAAQYQQLNKAQEKPLEKVPSPFVKYQLNSNNEL